MIRAGTLRPKGRVRMVVRRQAPLPGLRGFLSCALPRPGLAPEINAWRLRNLYRVLPQFVMVMLITRLARAFGVMTAYGRLSCKVIRDGVEFDYGIASYRLVTDTGVAFIVDALHAAATIANLKYHGYGTGTTNESAAQTALVTELTTEYASDNTRVTGSQGEGASANIYQTVATLDPDSAVAVTEHAVFDQAANSGGTMLDRSKFSAINLGATGDTLATTYELTLPSGG